MNEKTRRGGGGRAKGPWEDWRGDGMWRTVPALTA